MLVVVLCVLGHTESLCDLSCYNVDVSGHYAYYIKHTMNSSCMYVCKTEWDMRTEIFFHASFSTPESQGNVLMYCV